MEDKYSERFDTLEALIRVLVRQKLSNKAEKLMDEVQRRGRLTTSHVISFLNVSRPHAITLMRKVGEFPGFKCRIGDKTKQYQSVVIYDKSTVIQDQINIIKKLFVKNDIVTLSQIMEALGMDLENAKQIATHFVSTITEYELQENKIVKKS